MISALSVLLGHARRWFTPRRRRHIYDTANAALGVAVTYAVMNGQEAAAWLLLINVVLGMARSNTPSGRGRRRVAG